MEEGLLAPDIQEGVKVKYWQREYKKLLLWRPFTQHARNTSSDALALH
jgi:hypothetical protein